MAQLYYTPTQVATGKITGTVTDLLALVVSTNANFKSVSNGGHVNRTDGFDLIPYSDSGLTTKLKFWRFSYDPATGTVKDVVRLSSAAVATTIYYGYGDTGITTDQTDKNGTYNIAKAAFELSDGSTLDLTDYTGHGYGLTNKNGIVAGTTLLVSGSADLPNSTTTNAALINDSQPLTDNNIFTIVFTAYLRSGFDGVIWSKLDHNDNQWQGHYIGIDHATSHISIASVLNNFAAAGSTYASYTPDTVMRFAAIVNGASYRRMYANGIGGTADTTSVTPNYTQPQMSICGSHRSDSNSDPDNSAYHLVTDVLLIDGVMSDAWLEADTNAWLNYSSFWTWGSETSPGGGINIATPAGAAVLAGLLPSMNFTLNMPDEP